MAVSIVVWMLLKLILTNVILGSFQKFIMEYEGRYRQIQEQKFDCLLFDLDDTLYPLSAGLAVGCLKNIQEEVSEKKGEAMDVKIENARAMVLCNSRNAEELLIDSKQRYELSPPSVTHPTLKSSLRKEISPKEYGSPETSQKKKESQT